MRHSFTLRRSTACSFTILGLSISAACGCSSDEAAGSPSPGGGSAGGIVGGGSGLAGSHVVGQSGAASGLAGETSTMGGTTSGGGAANGGGAPIPPAGAANGGSPATVACPTNAAFCTGFEGSGMPAGTTYHPAYQTTGFAMFMKVSTTVTHSGGQALEVTGNDGYQWNMLSVPAPAASFWVRLYLRSSIDIGQSEHNSYYQAMTGDGEPNMGENVEVSEQYCQLVLNRKDDVVVSVGGMAKCGTGVPALGKNTWHCMETFFDGPNGVVQVYADNAKVIDKSGWTVENYKTFSFGYLGFHGPARTVWYDDVAVASARIGCP